MPSEPSAALDAAPGDAVLDVVDGSVLSDLAMAVCLTGLALGGALGRWFRALADGGHGIDHLFDHAIVRDEPHARLCTRTKQERIRLG